MISYQQIQMTLNSSNSMKAKTCPEGASIIIHVPGIDRKENHSSHELKALTLEMMKKIRPQKVDLRLHGWLIRRSHKECWRWGSNLSGRWTMYIQISSHKKPSSNFRLIEID
ncbi:hypothetical protein ElyMa_001875900 [Elysia marginata]|uniref:Uncharacterized protein n=1 Tax=Elysia marginata TaxID=1093978 RepID=A0AAV4ENW3_9GAST|nr:hypothetical protein ElyMa_001875900 [Elysia marginata]